MGSVSRTLTSVDSLQETGHDLILMKNHPRIFSVQTGEMILLRKRSGMFILDTMKLSRCSKAVHEERYQDADQHGAGRICRKLG